MKSLSARFSGFAVATALAVSSIAVAAPSAQAAPVAQAAQAAPCTATVTITEFVKSQPDPVQFGAQVAIRGTVTGTCPGNPTVRLPGTSTLQFQPAGGAWQNVLAQPSNLPFSFITAAASNGTYRVVYSPDATAAPLFAETLSGNVGIAVQRGLKYKNLGRNKARIAVTPAVAKRKAVFYKRSKGKWKKVSVERTNRSGAFRVNLRGIRSGTRVKIVVKGDASFVNTNFIGVITTR